MIGIVVPVKDRSLKPMFDSIPTDFYKDGKHKGKICLCIVCDSCSMDWVDQLQKEFEVYDSKIPTTIIAANNKSPFASRRQGVSYLLQKDTIFYNKYEPEINAIIFNDSDDTFTPEFWEYIRKNYKKLNKPSSGTITSFGWEFHYLDDSKPYVYWKPVTKDTWLKVPSMPCKVFSIELLTDLFNATPNPGIISGEEIDFLCNSIEFNNSNKKWKGKIKFVPEDISSVISKEHHSEDKNETLSSYTEQQKFFDTFDHHVNRYVDAKFKGDDLVVYAYRKAIADICSSYVKYSNDPLYTRTKVDEKIRESDNHTIIIQE